MQEWYAFEVEKELIAYYGRDRLCNLTDGGEGGSGIVITDAQKELYRKLYTGKPRSEETKRRMSESLKGKRHSEATKAAMRKIHKGKIFSEETRKRISAANKGRKLSAEHVEKIKVASKNKQKPVICSNGMVFESMTIAANWLKSIGYEKASITSISHCCRGESKLSYGFSWSSAK